MMVNLANTWFRRDVLRESGLQSTIQTYGIRGEFSAIYYTLLHLAAGPRDLKSYGSFCNPSRRCSVGLDQPAELLPVDDLTQIGRVVFERSVDLNSHECSAWSYAGPDAE